MERGAHQVACRLERRGAYFNLCVVSHAVCDKLFPTCTRSERALVVESNAFVRTARRNAGGCEAFGWPWAPRVCGARRGVVEHIDETQLGKGPLDTAGQWVRRLLEMDSKSLRELYR